MAALSKEEFEEKWGRKFADNTMQDITEAVLREFRQDIADSFAGLEPALRRQWKIRTYWPVIFLTHAEAVAYGRPNCLSLDQLPPELLCSGSMARVDLHPDKYGQELTLVFDERANATEGLRAYIDGSFTRYLDMTYDGLNPQKWVKKGSLDELLAGIRRYDPAYDQWVADETMKINFGGADAFFSARSAGGPFPAPTAAGQGTAYWLPAAAPQETGASEQYTVLNYAVSKVVDFAFSAQLLKLGGNLSVSATAGRRQGQQLRLHLANVTASAVALSWPAGWAWRGIVPAALAAGKQATLSLECAWGSAESDVVAGFVAQA